MAKGELRDGLGHVSFVYLKPEARGRGGGNDLVRDLVAHFREQGLEHVSLNVELPNDEALAYWRRLGFTDYRRSLLTDLESLERRLTGGEVASTGSIHLQTDDLGAVEKAVARWVPRVVRSESSVVGPPRNGWIGVYDDVAAGQPEQLRRLASELSYVSGGVVVALGVEQGEVVRLVAYDRGRVADEYLSVPEYYGPLPPGDAIAMRANPTLLGRLTGAKPAEIRAAARTADSAAELPPAQELLAEIAQTLGIEGVSLSAEEASALDGAVSGRALVNVVLLHAFPLDERMWEPQLEALADEDVYVPNFYDLGGNSVDGWAEHVLERVEGDLVAVGASLGGYVALAMARAAPDRVKSLLLAGARAAADPPERRAAREEMIRVVQAEGIEGWNREFAPPGPEDRTIGRAGPRHPGASRPARRDRRRGRLQRAADRRRRRPGRAPPGRRGPSDRRVGAGREVRGRRRRGPRRQRRRARPLQRDPAGAPEPGRLTATFPASSASRSISAFVGA